MCLCIGIETCAANRIFFDSDLFSKAIVCNLRLFFVFSFFSVLKRNLYNYPAVWIPNYLANSSVTLQPPSSLTRGETNRLSRLSNTSGSVKEGARRGPTPELPWVVRPWWTPGNAVFALPPQISLSNGKWRTILAGSLAALVSATRNKRLVRSALCIVQLEVHFARASSAAGLAVVGSVLSGSCYAIAVVRLVAAHELSTLNPKARARASGWKRDLPDRSSRPRRSAREVELRGNFRGWAAPRLCFSLSQITPIRSGILILILLAIILLSIVGNEESSNERRDLFAPFPLFVPSFFRFMNILLNRRNSE